MGNSSSSRKNTKSLSPSSYGEQECYRVLQRLFPRHKFRKVRPNFLNSHKTHHNLELDMYCEELNIAVEYNGRQHYEYVPYYHKCKEDFYDQVKRDRLKQTLCRKHKVKLIVVPYWITDIEEYLRQQLEKYGYFNR